MAKVHNLKGTSDNDFPAGYKSWIDFWEKKKGKSAKYCCNLSKFAGHGKAEVGAHVQKDSSDDHWFIVPLCKECNALTVSFIVEDSELVPV